MLELVDLGRQIDKEEYRKIFPALEARLGRCQRDAKAAGLPVLIVFEGWDAAGKGTLINRLTQALDPRGFTVHAISAPNETERFYPWMWRFWHRAPQAGRITVFDRSWYGRVLVERVDGAIKPSEVERVFEDIEDFERQLADGGAVILKFWLHISKEEQKRRFKRLEKDKATAWKVGKDEWDHHWQYGRYAEAIEEMLARTNPDHAPWTVVEATQKRFARVKVFENVCAAVEQQLARRAAQPPAAIKPMPAPKSAAKSASTLLSRVDLTLSLDRETYDAELKKLKPRLQALEHRLYTARLPAVIVFEGWDAAGKGGIIKRLTSGLDPRGYEVVPVGPPSAIERARHWLWRFWTAAPKAGHITIFDRSWYGRVLVERVEGFCTEADWRRAYREINEFERQLADFGAAIVKFHVHIDAAEQLRRFKERRDTPEKRWKLCDEDWRNRKKRPQYDVAVVDMLEQTSTPHAPWTILEANCKLHARIKALKTVAEALEAALKSH
jgi:polyphosphate:AMP phosphotransferase